jgi:carnitine 3-dehydrogenase
METVVRPEWVDYNRHMSDFRYSQVFGDAMDALFRRAGVDEAYRNTGRMYYTVENHVKHLAEAKVGRAAVRHDSGACRGRQAPACLSPDASRPG